MDNINEAKVKGDDFNMREKVFGFAPTEYFILDRYSEDLAPFYKVGMNHIISTLPINT